MGFDNKVLDRKALATFRALLKGVREAQLVESLCSAGEKTLSDMSDKFGIQRHRIDQDDRTRLSFEIVCFASFLIMSQEIPKLIIRKDASGVATADNDGIQYFNARFLEHLEQANATFMESTPVMEVLLTGIGEQPLSFARRMRQHVESSTRESEVNVFSRQIALVLARENHVLLKALCMGYVETIADLARGVLKTAFALDSPKNEALFDELERFHGDNYAAMIGQIYESFGRATSGRPVLFPEELATALDEAIQAPTEESWFRLKSLLLRQHRR